ncbi:hypothetical protein ACHAXA_006616 [Cyclostephanos tholiformis]|uniref:UDENN domain-containing protein n=1 Tax=Cyclostephanos tholiformis TaxID=382380 RepID=A0ABD3RB67_9STRA
MSSRVSSLSPGEMMATDVVATVPAATRPLAPSTREGRQNDKRDPSEAVDGGGGVVGGGDSISRRLVEYFVMVSCVLPKTTRDDADVTIANASGTMGRQRQPALRPPDPDRDGDAMNPRTRGRFEVRRVHLPTTPTPVVDGSTDAISPNDANAEDDEGEDEGVANALLEPRITARYPPNDHPNRPLNPRLPQFCHPESTGLIRPTSVYRMPRVHHFVLTDSMGGKLYGTALTVYEEFRESLGGEEEEEEKEKGREAPRMGRTIYYAPRVLTLLSTYPYLTAFRTYLTQLYRLATTTNVMTMPIERYVQNICSEVPAPPPGAFEVELCIHPSLGRAGKVRFWAPPADLPIPYVSLPHRVLFECLDVGNVLFAWLTLACEGKVLLVSSQLSLLTVCGEILCSLLFPMRWSHLYIPVLPRSLCPMLDAPMPYLCGINRENFPYAVEDISDETIVVDLDRNVVTIGPNAPDLPPLPNNRRKKLESVLKANVGDIFWEARNLNRGEVLKAKGSGNDEAIGTLLRNAHLVWEERISTCDDAFGLAHAPDSVTLDCDEDANDSCVRGGADLTKQSRWDAIQEGFLRFYVALLQDYRKFLPSEEEMGERSTWRGGGGLSSLRFKKEEFVASADKDFQPFLEELVQTQQFDDFVTRKMHNAADAADIKFFDQSIDAKRNRSKLTLRKKETNFLHAASARRGLKRINAVEPSDVGLPPLPEGQTCYMYKFWPVSFNDELFGTPRPIPSIISAEFDRRTAIRMMLRSKYGAVEGHRLGGTNRSPEVTAFILFFVTFTSVIGKELSVVEEKHRAGSGGGGPILHLRDSSPSRQLLTNFDDDMEVARTIAKVQIDLAYHTLSLMRARRLPPEPLVYELLILTCGRCKMTHVASLLMKMITLDGLATNSSIYKALIAAFSNDDSQPSSLALYQMLPFDNMSTLSMENAFPTMQSDSSTSGKFHRLETRTSTSEYSVDLSIEASSHGASSSVSTRRSRMSILSRNKHMFKSVREKMQKEAKLTPRTSKRQVLKVSRPVSKYIELGESLLRLLYPGIDIDTENACPKCAAVLTEDHICTGWVPCASNNYQTKCSFCGHTFVPKFSVACNSSSFQGSQGNGTPLYCDYFSPWVLACEIRTIMVATGGMDQILAVEFRKGTDISATLWWNMVVTFRRYKIPYIFLLQGNFHNNLILSSETMTNNSVH